MIRQYTRLRVADNTGARTLMCITIIGRSPVLTPPRTYGLEFRYKFPGQFLFHAHQNELTIHGWNAIFNVTA